jgi:hypothetical protein
MKTRQPGRNGPDVSSIGLGCMGLSFGLGPAADRKEAIQVIRSAVRDFDRNATAITSRSLIFARLLDVMDVGYVLLRSRCSP